MCRSLGQHAGFGRYVWHLGCIIWVEEELCGLSFHRPLAVALSAAQSPGNHVVCHIEILNSCLKAFCPKVSETIVILL